MAIPGAQRTIIFSPLRRAEFRRLWAGMGLSYAGDRLQELAQSWLVAVVTGSALAVGGISAVASIPQFFMPVGGVVADRVDRRKLLMFSQLAGAALSLLVGLLVATRLIAVWHIYAWALASGLIWLAARPAYKVVLTEAVPHAEVRLAVGLNSMTETVIMVLVSAAGSLMLQSTGLTVAFLLNSASYLLAAVSLWSLPGLGRLPQEASEHLALRGLAVDLKQGLDYLWHKPSLLHPLLLTFATVVAVTPTFGLLAAIVHAQGGTILSLGLLSTAGALGMFAGAVFAGSRGEGARPVLRYAGYGLLSALSLAVFAFLPVGYLTPLPLALIGFLLFSQAVWNTSRVRLVAEPAFQARLQALTTTAFVLGGAVGQLWGGVVVDRWGPHSLTGGALVLALISSGFAWRAARSGKAYSR